MIESGWDSENYCRTAGLWTVYSPNRLLDDQASQGLRGVLLEFLQQEAKNGRNKTKRRLNELARHSVLFGAQDTTSPSGSL